MRPQPRGWRRVMNQIIDTIEKEQQKSDAKSFSVGDSVRVHTRVVEGDKERVQIFAGIVIGRKGRGINETFTVRRISYRRGRRAGISPAFPAHRKSGSGKTRPRSPRETKLSSHPQGERSDSSSRVIDVGRDGTPVPSTRRARRDAPDRIFFFPFVTCHSAQI